MHATLAAQPCSALRCGDAPTIARTRKGPYSKGVRWQDAADWDAADTQSVYVWSEVGGGTDEGVRSCAPVTALPASAVRTSPRCLACFDTLYLYGSLHRTHILPLV